MCAEVGVASGVACQSLRTLQLILASLSKALSDMTLPTDTVAVALHFLESKFSEKFFTKLYR